MSLWFGPEPAPVAVERCERLLAAHGTERNAVHATLGFPLTVLCAIQGRSAQAHEHLAVTHLAMAAISYAAAHVMRPLLTALVAIADDEPRTAETAFLEALDAARGTPPGARLINMISLELARLRLTRACWREAAELVDDLVIDEDRAERAGHLGIRAWISAYETDAGAVSGLAAAAEAAARDTDSPVVQAVVLLDRAHANAVLGNRPAAVASAEAARRLFAAKGDLSGAARTHRLLADLGDPRHGDDDRR
jgi:hypothetical protein